MTVKILRWAYIVLAEQILYIIKSLVYIKCEGKQEQGCESLLAAEVRSGGQLGGFVSFLCQCNECTLCVHFSAMHGLLCRLQGPAISAMGGQSPSHPDHWYTGPIAADALFVSLAASLVTTCVKCITVDEELILNLTQRCFDCVPLVLSSCNYNRTLLVT